MKTPTRKPAASPKATPPRKRGRPPKVEAPLGTAPLLSRNALIDHAAAMTRHTPLDQISMVQIAKDFGVAPGLIHYYLGGREGLISGVMNKYHHGRLEKLPALTGDWRHDVEDIARISFATAADVPGISLYLASHNRFRLFQDVGPGETDYGIAVFNHITSAFLQGGFSPEAAALAYHLLAQFLLASSVAVAGRQSPAEHHQFILEKFEAITDARFEAAKVVGRAFSALDADRAFNEGLRLLLDGFASWQAPVAQAKARKGKPAARSTLKKIAG